MRRESGNIIIFSLVKLFFFEAVLADKRQEYEFAKGRFFKAALMLSQLHHLLTAERANRRNQYASYLQLGKKRFWNAGAGGSNNNLIERGILEVVLDVDMVRSGAVRLYEKFGFKIDKAFTMDEDEESFYTMKLEIQDLKRPDS